MQSLGESLVAHANRIISKIIGKNSSFSAKFIKFAL